MGKWPQVALEPPTWPTPGLAIAGSYSSSCSLAMKASP